VNDRVVKRLVFSQGDLAGNTVEVTSRVEEKLRDLFDQKSKSTLCKDPKKISDDCWACSEGRVICTSNAVLRVALERLFRKDG
jgi:hypothetical protein